MMRFASLGSGSKGNATLITAADTAVLVDCGFSVKETLLRMARLDFAPERLTAILVTHEHGDHAKGVMALSRRLKVPVYMSAGTAIALDCIADVQVRVIDLHQSFALGDVHVHPVAVPHDAREACQFVLSFGEQRLGILTDLGHVTPHVVSAYQAVDALILEANHDPEMLAVGPYPPSLKRRVGGPLGHLSNGQSAELLSQIDLQRLQRVVISHISEQNNDLSLAESVLAAAIPGHEAKLQINLQDTGFDWCQIQPL
ncbi:MBL fold metallo-hydrolase [Salinispirillum sp. LH 10-3-1]|uniref:MBL fold metallo-hydrolase n=1 Tax=Salinispirillum sp. LH 10-3-1 TaxID=2952525 RepID=A0AB38YDN6_9GAMM